MKILVNYDFSQNEIQNTVIQRLTAAPTNPAPLKGQIYFNTVSNQLFYYNGTSWVAADSSNVPAQVNADWNSSSGVSQILNKPTLGTVASKNVGTGSGNIPELDGSGKLDSSLLPAIAITDTFVVASQTAMLALTAQVGDIAVRTDLNKSFILRVLGASTLANWQELLTPTDTVTSINGQTGAVSLTAASVGAAPTSHNHAWSNITSGVPDQATRWPAWSEVTSKPTTFTPSAHNHAISDVTGLQTALDGKASTGHTHDYAGTYMRRYAQVLSTSSTTYTITHGLDTQDVVVMVRDAAAPFAQVICDVECTSTTTVTLRFATAPVANAYRVVVIG